MTPLESNIETTRKAAQAIEKQLTDTLHSDPDKIVELTAKMQRYINTTNLLMQMKAIVQPDKIVKPVNKLELV